MDICETYIHIYICISPGNHMYSCYVRKGGVNLFTLCFRAIKLDKYHCKYK